MRATPWSSSKWESTCGFCSGWDKTKGPWSLNRNYEKIYNQRQLSLKYLNHVVIAEQMPRGGIQSVPVRRGDESNKTNETRWIITVLAETRGSRNLGYWWGSSEAGRLALQVSRNPRELKAPSISERDMKMGLKAGSLVESLFKKQLESNDQTASPIAVPPDICLRAKSPGYIFLAGCLTWIWKACRLNFQSIGNTGDRGTSQARK